MGTDSRLLSEGSQNLKVRTKPDLPLCQRQGLTGTVPLPVLGAVSDRLVCLAVIQPALPACLLTPSWESAFHLSQPGLRAKATEDLDLGWPRLDHEPLGLNSELDRHLKLTLMSQTLHWLAIRVTHRRPFPSPEGWGRGRKAP